MYNGRTERLRELSRGAPPRIQQPKGIALPLYPHQVSAAEYASLAPRIVLSDRPGTGKDYCAIAAQVEVAEGRFLVTAPPVLIGTWERHLRQAMPDRQIVTFDPGRGIANPELVAGDIVLLRHRQMTRAVEQLAEVGFHGLIFDQCQTLACCWSRLATAARRFVQGLAQDAPVVASSSQAAASPRTLASVVEVIGRLERHPRLATIRTHRSWASVRDARSILEDLRGDCLLARDADTVLSMSGRGGALRLARCR